MYDGMINIRKEKEFTSHDVVAKMRGILHQKKIGHTGTLDPDAVGVLPVCLGKATKLCDMITDKDKTYRTVMLLGKVTDTQDVSGQIIESHSVEVTDEEVKQAAMSFVGDYMQIPPMYSAIKIGGQKLYDLARQGIEVERKPRHIVIYEMTVESVDLPYVTMEVRCSKGSYIRTLCHDIGQKLGCGACMAELTRTKVGIFDLQKAITLDELDRLMKETPEQVKEYIIPVEDMLSELKSVKTIDELSDKMLLNGNKLELNQFDQPSGNGLMDAQEVKVYDRQGIFRAVYRFDEAGQCLKNVKMFI